MSKPTYLYPIQTSEVEDIKAIQAAFQQEHSSNLVNKSFARYVPLLTDLGYVKNTSFELSFVPFLTIMLGTPRVFCLKL